MKTHASVKARGQPKVNAQQVNFELRHKVVLALNKLSDRDTYQIGVEELEKTAQTLTPDGISPFLSCILDTDSKHKTSLRKECIRLMGAVTIYHGGLVVPYLPKMVTSIVKRLRDPDSIVRDACVDTAGVLASKLINHGGEKDKIFLEFVRPLFEALGEQNKQVQSGSAYCLARIIDNTHNPPVSVLQKMLTRTVKLLKNPHFMAKPAIVQLNKSIILAGGAPTQNILSTSIVSIREALKDSDWTTRKAASLALGEIGLSGGSFLGFLKDSCIYSLESCRFDKVKPVRDSVLQAIKYWRNLPGSNTPEPSETGSSIKENVGGDSADLSSTTESGQRDTELQRVAIKSTGRLPFSVRKACPNYGGNRHQHKQDDWHVEMVIPKTYRLVEFQNEESEGSSVTRALERMSTDVTSLQDLAYEYVPMDDKQEWSSVSNLTTDNFECKRLTVSDDCLINNGLPKPTGRSQQFSGEELSCEEKIYSVEMTNCRSSDSTATGSSSQSTQGSCLQLANEMVCVRKQLSDIATKQANFMDKMQVFTTGVMDALSAIQSRVVGLEHILDRLAQGPVQAGSYSYSDNTRCARQSQIFISPICTPRPSVHSNNRQPVSLSDKSSDNWKEKAFARSLLRNPAREKADICTNPKVKTTSSFVGEDILNSSGQDAQSLSFAEMRKNDVSSSPRANARIGCSESNNSYCKLVKGHLCEGDLDSAYVEALFSGNELVLAELLSRTGPVLESLSPKTVDDLFSSLASYLLEGRFLNIIIPWLQQVVDLSTIHGPYCIDVSAKAREQLLSAVQEAVNFKFLSNAERQSAAQFVVKLHQIWGKC